STVPGRKLIIDESWTVSNDQNILLRNIRTNPLDFKQIIGPILQPFGSLKTFTAISVATHLQMSQLLTYEDSEIGVLINSEWFKFDHKIQPHIQIALAIILNIYELNSYRAIYERNKDKIPQFTLQELIKDPVTKYLNHMMNQQVVRVRFNIKTSPEGENAIQLQSTSNPQEYFINEPLQYKSYNVSAGLRIKLNMPALKIIKLLLKLFIH
ncbi:8350_t:CDS:2, partial [Cetraspora pellucida]